MRFYKERLIAVTLLLVSSCGKGSETPPVQTETGVTEMDFEVRPPGLLYVQDNSSAVYTVTGNGGVGEPSAFEKSDSLTPYDGIPIITTGIDAASKLNALITSTGDPTCENMFAFNPNSLKISIDGSKVKSLTTCHVQITLSTDTEGTSLTKQKNFDIAFNPTLKSYFTRIPKDKFVIYWTKPYMNGQGDIAGIAGWIKANSVINLNWDITNTDYLKDINSITGAQNITSLDLSNSKVEDIKALQFLPNLQSLNLSNTKISQESLEQLASLPNLTTLIIRNMESLTNITYITENLKNLTYLDISNNPNLYDLSSIKNLKKLKTLIASSVGLKTGFQDLAALIELTTLDISKNDLSKLGKLDAEILARLFKIQDLNVSETKVSDEFLNYYFYLISFENNLKRFVDRNNYNRFLQKDCSFNRFSDTGEASTILNIEKLTNLEYLDVHGNSCFMADGTLRGITNLNFLSKLTKLKYLDISNNAITNLENQNTHISLLNNLNITNPDKNLIMNDLGDHTLILSKTSCRQQLGESSPYLKNCDIFPDATIPGYTEFTQANSIPVNDEKTGQLLYYESKFKVPNGVTSILVSGCSGGDGGQGGQGGQGGFASQNFNGLKYANEPRTNGWEVAKDICDTDDHGNIYNCFGIAYFKATKLPGLAALGKQGNISNVLLTSADGSISLSELYKTNQTSMEAGDPPVYDQAKKLHCYGGRGGLGGLNGGVSVLSEDTRPSTSPSNGSAGAQGAGKRIVSGNVSVIPNQILTIRLGLGGKGGAGGEGSQNGGCSWSDAGKQIPNPSSYNAKIYCANNGSQGTNGDDGYSGFISFSWKK